MTEPTAFGSNPRAAGLDDNTEQFDGADCPNTRVPHLCGINASDNRAVIFRPRCKMWSCPVCGKMNAWAWSFRGRDGAHALYDAGKPMSFVTITSHERLTPGQSWWVMPKAWMKLQARVRRQVGKFSYFQLPELTDALQPHLHMICTAMLSKDWWKDNARECGFGYMDDAQEVWKLGGVIGYCMKYLTKTLTHNAIPAHTRRVRTSRDWPKASPRDPPPDWQFLKIPKKTPILNYAQRLEDNGLTVHIMGSRSAWSIVRPDE